MFSNPLSSLLVALCSMLFSLPILYFIYCLSAVAAVIGAGLGAVIVVFNLLLCSQNLFISNIFLVFKILIAPL
jgi:hypothetical protein